MLLPLAQVDGTATAISNAVSWSNTYTLPSGGTWIYFRRYVDGGSNVFVSGTVSGGTAFKDTSIQNGIAIRKS